MKEWVKPLLLQRKHQTPKQFECEQAVYYEMVAFLKHDFGVGLGWPTEFFIETFGSVLADLPQEVFNKVSHMENVFFIFTPFPGAEVKIFQLKSDLRAGALRIVNFPFDTSFMPAKALKGEVAHELAHIYAEHDIPSEEMEDEADEIAQSWGFEEEIRGFRDFEKEYWEENWKEVKSIKSNPLRSKQKGKEVKPGKSKPPRSRRKERASHGSIQKEK